MRKMSSIKSPRVLRRTTEVSESKVPVKGLQENGTGRGGKMKTETLEETDSSGRGTNNCGGGVKEFQVVHCRRES